MKKDEFLMQTAMMLKNLAPTKTLTDCVKEAKDALREAQKK